MGVLWVESGKALPTSNAAHNHHAQRQDGLESLLASIPWLAACDGLN
jgi:hypothetical protein